MKFFKHFMFDMHIWLDGKQNTFDLDQKHFFILGKQILFVVCLLANFSLQMQLSAKLANKNDQSPNTDIGQTMLASIARLLAV